MKNIILWLRIALKTLIYALKFIKTSDRAYLKKWSENILKISGVNVVCSGQFPDGTFIIMANHESYFDIFAMFVCCQFNLIWFAKKELFKIPVFGLALKKSNAIAVDRSNPIRSSFALLRAIKLQKKDEIMVIFPQGTRKRKDTFKEGGILIAKKKNIPIVPVKILGSHQVLSHGSCKINNGTIIVKIYDKIDVEKISVSEIENIVKDKIYE